MAKSIFIDTTRCTACRGCQVACKQWHDHEAVPTLQTGTHQNPPDLTPHNFKLVRFSEHKIDGRVHWLFFPNSAAIAYSLRARQLQITLWKAPL